MIRKDSIPSRKVTRSDCSSMSGEYTPVPAGVAGGKVKVRRSRAVPARRTMMRRNTLAAATGALAAFLAIALGAGGMAHADEAAGHYNLALQYKREGKVAQAISECERAIALRA